MAALVNGGDNLSGKVVKLINDIDLAGASMETIGKNTAQFAGTFDGNGKTIKNLTIDKPTVDYVGFIGSLGTGGVVKDLKLENSGIKGKNYVGSVVGENRGTVENCYNTGSVTAIYSYIGGVVGLNTNGTVKNCYNTGNVSGGLRVGGVAG